MTRQMQELWLFGQLKTLDQKPDIQQQIDSDAKEVAEMLAQLLSIKGLMMDESEVGATDTTMQVDGQTTDAGQTQTEGARAD